jgi:hypothetical protein
MRTEILQAITDADTSFQVVAGIADISAIMPSAGKRPSVSLQNLPGLFMHFNGQGAGKAQDRPGGFTQMTTDRWGFILVTRSINDGSGIKNANQVDELVVELDSILLGFQPAGAASGIRKSSNAGLTLRWDRDLHYYESRYELDKRLCTHRG